ncbi:MAG: tetratricopeptide repeat protein [Candidatus Thorarchaeota archaeon]|jgi:tetratricopeptide (TPR) repeat protein
MYERFQPTDRVFVDREEYLDWMSEALERCKEQSVVLHLRGIGGIGKSSLLDHWKSTIDDTIRLDCEQYTDFYARLNVIAKGAVLLGVNLQRFDVLWQIRQRFVEGVEPVKEKGREWAKEVVMAIPFIGSLASIGSAIGAVGATVSPKLKGRYGNLGEWLQTRLGKDHIQRLLEILWKEPRHAEFLYLDALLEDLNNRKTSEKPIVFLLDHSEHVDDERCRWHYGGREISETELWYVFLTSLSNCVGVMASRQAVPSQTSEELDIEESELTELDRESCIELLEQRQIRDPELQEKIVSVSGGNPFVIGAMCDLAESSGLSLSDVEDLRADTLEEVRLRIWRRLFSQAQDLLGLVEKTGLVPFFNRRIMTVVAPDMRTDHWDRLIRLSFVRDRGDGTWVVHDLARELIMAELGQRLQYSTDEVARLLEESSTQESDYTLLGLAISVQALASEMDAAAKAGDIVFDLLRKNAYSETLAFVDAVRIETKEGQVVLRGLRGSALSRMGRVADGEQELLGALEKSREISERIPDELLVFTARTLRELGMLLYRTDRDSEAEETYREALRIYRELDEKTPSFRLEDMAWTLVKLGFLLGCVNRLKEAEKMYREAHQLFKESAETPRYDTLPGITESLLMIGLVLHFAGKTSEAEEVFREAIVLFREIADKDPNVQVRFTVALLNFGEFLRMTSRPNEAEEAFREVLEVSRERAKKEPESMMAATWVAANLINLALPLTQTGRYSEAEAAYVEALNIARKCAEKTPVAFERLVGWTLLDYAVLLRQTGRTSDAEKTCREALEIHRELAAKSPRRHLSKVAWNLNNLAVLLRQTGRASEAEEAYLEALDIARELRHEAPEAVFMTDLLATILNNLAVLLRQTGRPLEMKEAILEALKIRRQLAQRSPEVFLHRVATTLNNLGVLLFETDKSSEAEEVLREALQLRKGLAEESPDQFRPGIASTLSNLAVLLRRTGRTSESESVFREAIDIGEELMLKAPTVYQHGLVRPLCNYALLLSDINSTNTLKETMTRLEELGVESLPESEEWSEEEEDEANPPGGV